MTATSKYYAFEARDQNHTKFYLRAKDVHHALDTFARTTGLVVANDRVLAEGDDAPHEVQIGTGAIFIVQPVPDVCMAMLSLNVRAGSKRHKMVQLLLRPEGATAAEVAAHLGSSSVNVPMTAYSMGLPLRQERQGRVMRYWADIPMLADRRAANDA